jgi:hypothetical protein
VELTSPGQQVHPGDLWHPLVGDHERDRPGLGPQPLQRLDGGGHGELFRYDPVVGAVAPVQGLLQRSHGLGVVVDDQQHR